MNKSSITADVYLPIKDINKANKLIEEGYYTTKSDFIREAIRELIRKHKNKEI